MNPPSPPRLRDRLRPWDRARYLLWRLGRGRGALRARLRTGERIEVRPAPALDATIAYEVFVAEVYRDAAEGVADVRRVVDLGGNVGYTCLYWLSRFPGARVRVFEPHPGHVERIRRHLALNGWADRAEVVAAAAGTAAGEAFLTDEESHSAVVAGAGPGRVPIRVVDFFEAAGPGPIDLLKVDIEGGEHALLDDPRFAALPVRALILEWHGTAEHPDGRRHCADRLAAMGYRVKGGETSAAVGLLRARRDPTADAVAGGRR